MRSFLRWSTVLAAAALAGCGDDTSGKMEGGVVDAGSMDASLDSTAEAGPDGTIDGTMEASKEASVVDSPADADASRDAGVTDAPADATDAGADSGVPSSVIAEPGYSVTLWAKGTADYFNPDSIDYDGTHFWVGFQNMTTKDDSDGGPGYGTTSTIVEYAADGSVLAKYSMPGHNDGLRYDPTGHKVWATSNEDGSPHLVSIDPAADASTAVVEYTIVLAGDGGADHGGGYDDLRFFGGNMYVAASAPPIPVQHVQALDQVSISGTTATFTPVLYDDSLATPVGGDASAPLSLGDPDSIALDDQGRLVLVSQQDSQLIFLSGLGDAATPTASVLTLPTQPEDPVWITKATGRMLLVDGTANAIYEIHTSFAVGTVFTETPNDSTIPGILATINSANVNPPTVPVASLSVKISGFLKPTGLIFVPSP